MTTPAYIDWFRNLLIPSLPAERPVRKLAITNGIHMLKLPPRLTHLLQPLDVGVFKSMKVVWYSVVADFTRRERKNVTNREFPELITKVWLSYKEETGVGGFRGCAFQLSCN